MGSQHTRGHRGSKCRQLGVCLALLALPACGDDWHDRLREETLATKQMEAEERAELAAIEESERAALQLERDLAIAAIENDRGEPPRPLSADEFEGVLDYYCGNCHGLDNYDAGFRFETVEDLIESQRIIPGDAASSRVVLRLTADEMPPVRSGRPLLPPATIQLIADFIDSLPPPPPTPPKDERVAPARRPRVERSIEPRPLPDIGTFL